MKNNDNLLALDNIRIKDKIIKFIRRYVIKLKKDGTLVGLSGGLDSCIVLRLCVDAVGSENVRAVILPERDSDPVNLRDAKKFALSLSVPYTVKKISPLLWWLGVYRLYPPSFLFPRTIQARFVKKQRRKISDELGEDIFIANLEGGRHRELNKGMAFYRIKHRIRSSILFYYAELNNLLMVGTSNKSEWLTGFFVKYGDNIADIMPLSSLYKTQVKSLAGFIGIDSHIIEKPPSPDLIPGIVDEEMLKMPYYRLDHILYGIEHNYDDNNIARISDASIEEIDRVRMIINKSEYLRSWPVTKVL